MIQVEFTPRNVVLNSIAEPKYGIANFLCLVTKQFIYRCKCQNKKPHFPVWKEEVRKIENIEKYIAVKNKKLRIHERKWKC